jgi:hypothetical protein
MTATGDACVRAMDVSRAIRPALLLVLATVALAGCASAPSAPPAPITDMRQIEGKWQGLITLGFGGPQERYYLTVKPDGGLVAQWGMNWQWGKVTRSGGSASFEMDGLTNGTITYYEGPGGRSLVLNANFDAWSANVTPVK